ncbi:MAG: ABC transporter ATP-binding protein [Planctomycetota bacterium]|jgi:ABC-2 type transport system ATP-binding protein
MIHVREITKKFGPVVAVDKISFDVEAGGVVGFLGPNGAGKSTTMKILTCYQPATSGSASVAGHDVFKESLEVRRSIGYLPENTPLYPELRAREYLHFRGKLRGMTRPQRNSAIERVTERCWLDKFIDRPIGQLSKGMKQRVGLADAIMHEPQLLILDEPTIGLDPNQIRETRNLIKELGDAHTVLLSSHILHEVEQICSNIIIIKSGKIAASGSPAELRARFSRDSKIVAELKGPLDDVKKNVTALDGVNAVDAKAENGWVRLKVTPQPDRDIREELFNMTTANGWSLREMHREGATLEDFFVQVTADQHKHN